MAVALSGTNVDGSNVFSTAGLGAGAGDWLVISYHAFASGAPSAPAGWSTAGSGVVDLGGASTGYVAIFYLLLTGSPAASYTVTRGGSNFYDGGRIWRVAGADTAGPHDSGTALGSSGTMATGAVVDSPTGGALIMAGTTEGVSMSTPSGTTQRYEIDAGDAEGWEQLGALTGANKTSTLGSSNEWGVAWITFAPAGGSTTNQSLNVTSTTTATIKRSVGKILAKTVTSTATMSRAKQAVKALAVTVTTTRTMLRSVGKVVSVTGTTTATMTRSLTWAKALSATSTTTTSMVRTVGKFVAATSTTTASMMRQTGKVVAASATTTASSVRSVGKTIAFTSSSTATLVATKAFQVALSVTSATTATMGRQVSKVVAVTSSTTASIVRSVGKVLSVTSTATSVLSATKAFQMVLSVTSTTTATVSLTVGKLVSAASIGTATVRKSVAKTFRATSTTTASIGKSIGKVLGAVGSLVTGLIATFQGAGDVEQVIGLARIFDEATAHALLHDSLVNTALVSDELTGRVEVRD